MGIPWCNPDIEQALLDAWSEMAAHDWSSAEARQHALDHLKSRRPMVELYPEHVKDHLEQCIKALEQRVH